MGNSVEENVLKRNKKMSCILRVNGKHFDVDSFIKRSKLKPYKISYAGHPKLASMPEGKKLEYSGLSIEASKADFDNLNKQIKDVIRFLRKNKLKLDYINSDNEIENAVLDFGIDLRIDNKKVLIQSNRFPAELLKLAGALNIDIEHSIYPIDLEKTLAKLSEKKTIL